MCQEGSGNPNRELTGNRKQNCLALIICSSFVLGQENIKIPDEPIQQTYQNPSHTFMSSSQADLLFFPLVIISLIIGIVIIFYMIKKSPRKLNLAIQGLIALISGISLIYLFFFTGQIYDIFDIFGRGIPLPLFALSLYFTIKLIKEKDFENRQNYGLNLSSGMIILTILIVISSSITELIFPPIAFGGLAELMLLAVGVMLSFIAGVIGIFIDKKRK